jgi:hypothetical protein
MPSLAARLAIRCTVLSGLVIAAPAALAQSNVCAEGPAILEKRRALIERINALGKNKRPDPQAACRTFGELVTNGSTAMKWIETNGDWCQVPGNLREGIKADHERATKFRAQACDAAKKVADMERRARQQQQGGGGGGLLGGDGLTGPMRMPQGAL